MEERCEVCKYMTCICNSPEKEFYQWMDSHEEMELWSGNYNNASRDEFIAKRAWDYQQRKIDELQRQLEELEYKVLMGLV